MKKYFAVMLTVVLLMSLAEGCGSSGSGDQTAGTEATETGAAQSSAADTSSGSEAEAEETPEVKAFNIYSIGEDFKNRVQDFYPGYEAAGENSGMIGDVPVVWHIYTDASEYRDVLDEKLESGTDQDEGVDLFVVEETYLRDYVESAASMDVIGEVGLTQEDLSDQFLYTQQMATDADGKLKAVSWQAAPGVFAYRRSIAREVLGTDDPEKVQEAVADWEAFADTAEAVKEAGYYMLSGYEDAYRVYADNVTSAWVENGALNIDPHLEDWAVQTREFAEKGYTHGTEQWSGKVFGFFYSSWGIHYTLQTKAEGGEDDAQSASGDYAVCRGPEPSHYGGQWIIASKDCGNIELARSIMKTLTCDPEVMKKITKDIREFTNTVSGMTELAQSDYKAEVLGGQNPIPVYVESAKLLSKMHTTTYDDDLDTGFQVTMQDYFAGRVSEIDALETFRKVALSRYEELLDIAGDEEEEQ